MTSPRFPTWKSGFPDNSSPARNRQISFIISWLSTNTLDWHLQWAVSWKNKKYSWISNRRLQTDCRCFTGPTAFSLTDQAVQSIYSYRIGLFPITHACELGYLQRHTFSLYHPTPLLKCWIYRKIPTHLHWIWPVCETRSHRFTPTSIESSM